MTHYPQVVPYADSGPLSAKLVQNGTLKTYKGFPHGMPTTQAETINADLDSPGGAPGRPSARHRPPAQPSGRRQKFRTDAEGYRRETSSATMSAAG